MKLRILSLIASWIVRALTSTLRVRHVHPEHIENTPQYILAFWHRQLLPLLGKAHWKGPITVMSSQSKDGQFSTATLARFGIESVSGSSTRGGSAAVRGILRVARGGRSIVFTPDGPRGPAGVVKDGVIFTARASQLPIVPLAFALKKYKQLGSWDRMMIPIPFSKGVCVYGEPMIVPRDGDIEEWRLKLERTLKELSEEAERLVKET
ncbi:MAG TPA: lysophospholipid acyltransferase family protein [Thermoanaerobaculia bacterium]|nr:lysophospholipid acyltransferase family protein [Thermoanaerobaculia bacterium]